MKDFLQAIGAQIKAHYEAQHDPERTKMQSDGLRILGNEHDLAKQWERGELTDTEFYEEALKVRKETARHYPDAKFQLGDSVRYEQKPVHVYGYIRGIDLWRGKQFVYTVFFIDGNTHRINEAHLHVWHTTPIGE